MVRLAVRIAVACSVVASVSLAISKSVIAQDHPWHFRIGPALVSFTDASADVYVGGEKVPGGNAAFRNNGALAFELGYTLAQRLTVRFALGIPPTTTITAKGSLRDSIPPLSGKIGEVTYGPLVLSVTYTPIRLWRFEPYFGVGANYTYVFDAKDADLAGLHVDSAFGAVLQVGTNIRIHPQWAVFIDVRKVFVGLDATGTIPALGGPPAKAEITLNPWLLHAGAEFRL